MKRDLKDRAYSLFKYQIGQGFRNKTLPDAYRYCKAMDAALGELVAAVPNHLVVAFDDLVNLRGIEAISRFVGKELDTSLIDASRVSAYPADVAHDRCRERA
jgi:hypothetical protein